MQERQRLLSARGGAWGRGHPRGARGEGVVTAAHRRPYLEL